MPNRKLIIELDLERTDAFLDEHGHISVPKIVENIDNAGAEIEDRLKLDPRIFYDLRSCTFTLRTGDTGNPVGSWAIQGE